MSNTMTRIVSSFAMLAIVAITIYLGKEATIIFLGVVGLIMIDEISVNFFDIERKHHFYFLTHLSFLAPFIFFNFVEQSRGIYQLFINAGIILDVILLAYLFLFKKEDSKIFQFIQNYSFLVGPIVLIPIMSLCALILFKKWVLLFIALLIINAGMDTGAWFCGKNWGKHKLWEKVSPNKTVEGLIGGMIISSLLASLYWWMAFKEFKPVLSIIFLILALFSQLGDLIQSKLKRQFEIKDSSSLIPGHGGVYDRIDSLVFIAPLFSALLIEFYPY